MTTALKDKGLVPSEPIITVAEHERILTELKEKVRSVAGKYAQEHDWCSQVDEALEEMGIEGGIVVRHTVRLTLTVVVAVNANEDNAEAAATALLPERLTLKMADFDGEIHVGIDVYESEVTD